MSTLRFSRIPIGDGDKEIGSVSASMGYIVIEDHRREPSHETEYVIPLGDVWDAFQEAIEDQDEDDLADFADLMANGIE
jgi:hypothetical protein